jgi:hypothetical protein
MSENLNEQIRHRAYLLWESNGADHGNDWDFWLQAEAEVLAEQAAPAPGSAEIAPTQAEAPVSAAPVAEKPRKATPRKAAASKSSPAKTTSAKAAAPAKPRRARKTSSKTAAPVAETTES